MTHEDVAAIVRQTMPDTLLEHPGAVMLTGPATLKPAAIYIMGLNPGGAPTDIPGALIDSVTAREGTSGYTHECWQPGCIEPQPCRHLDDSGATHAAALVRHQRNMIALTSALDGTPASLFSANAVFARSTSLALLKRQTGLGLADWWAACWPVHQRFLAIVRPRMIVTLGYGEGSSAFGLLRARAGYPSYRKVSDDGRRGGWAFDARLDLCDGDELAATVIGVPHPSYHAPGPVLSEMLAECAAGVLEL